MGSISQILTYYMQSRMAETGERTLAPLLKQRVLKAACLISFCLCLMGLILASTLR